ncbi:hypothetical protein OJAV_G00025120 [Oryzias javanicus]|uniref:Uncharacterized protein n=1 Tax=Oryzias javanicus TaxID=123683 RepID=A0A437DIH2_ORYJA|nr:hypothetical protein OJAV_G00025120 [Oryzias javanicus]
MTSTCSAEETAAHSPPACGRQRLHLTRTEQCHQTFQPPSGRGFLYNRGKSWLNISVFSAECRLHSCQIMTTVTIKYWQVPGVKVQGVTGEADSFEVLVGEQLIYSKLETGKFPDAELVEQKVRELLPAGSTKKNSKFAKLKDRCHHQ